MNFVFSAEGFRALRGTWIVLGLALAVSVAIVAASTWFLQREKRESVLSGRRLQEAQARVEGVRRERDSMQESAVVFRTLVARGVLQAENRLDLVEHVNALRSRHHLELDYEILPQRPLALGGGRSFTAVDVLASRMRFKARGLHEGDVLAFVDELQASRHGFYTIDRCILRRLEVTGPAALQPRVEADCALEWITLKEKRGNRPA